MVYDVRFSCKSIEHIQCRAHKQAHFRLDCIPDLLFMLNDFLVMLYLEIIEFVDLSLEYSQCFAERLQVFYFVTYRDNAR